MSKKKDEKKRGRPGPGGGGDDIDLGFKMPRLDMPPDFKLDSTPLFSLPEKFMSRKSCLSKMKRLHKPVQRVTTPMQSYSGMRKAKDEFRKRVIALIIQDEAELMSANKVPIPDEKDINRYYYYIRNGFDTIHVPSMDKKLFLKITALIPEKLQRLRKTMKENVADMKEDYMLAVKKAIVDFVLKDPYHPISILQEYHSPEREEILKIISEAKGNMKSRCNLLQRKLNALNPSILEVMNLWGVEYDDFRILPISEFEEYGKACNLEIFNKTVSKQFAKSYQILSEKWMQEIHDMFLHANKRNLLPDPIQKVRWKKFYDCVAFVMASELASLITHSIEDYTNFMVAIHDKNKGFLLNLINIDGKPVYQPSISEVESSVLSVYEQMIDTISNLNRLETRLYLEYTEPTPCLKVCNF